MIRFVLLKEHFGYGVENGLDLQTQLGAETLVGGH